MKLHIGGLVLVLFSLVLPMAAQDSGNTIDPAYKKIVWNNTTVTLTGPIGTGDAPTVLQVTGGMGGPASMGSGIQLTAGDGGGSHPSGPDGGDGARSRLEQVRAAIVHVEAGLAVQSRCSREAAATPKMDVLATSFWLCPVVAESVSGPPARRPHWT